MKSTITLITLSIIVLGTLVYGFLDGGSPQAARNKKTDQTRYSNIQSINYSVDSYYRKYGVFPASISEAVADYPDKKDLLDPETKQPYEYINNGDGSYKLCATFSTNTMDDSLEVASKTSHSSGHYCYTFTPSN